MNSARASYTSICLWACATAPSLCMIHGISEASTDHFSLSQIVKTQAFIPLEVTELFLTCISQYYRHWNSLYNVLWIQFFVIICPCKELPMKRWKCRFCEGSEYRNMLFKLLLLTLIKKDEILKGAQFLVSYVHKVKKIPSASPFSRDITRKSSNHEKRFSMESEDPSKQILKISEIIRPFCLVTGTMLTHTHRELLVCLMEPCHHHCEVQTLCDIRSQMTILITD